jgi:hypothetical protein
MNPSCWWQNAKLLAAADKAARGQANSVMPLLFQLDFPLNLAIGQGCLWLWA